ncbi:MAG: hypothetical protein E6J34_24220 [Chloroflexi bacterium]|nr:MAG: hypothetical protein E6J34_24220 [Chloroflexota bacterium]
MCGSSPDSALFGGLWLPLALPLAMFVVGVLFALTILWPLTWLMMQRAYGWTLLSQPAMQHPFARDGQMMPQESLRTSGEQPETGAWEPLMRPPDPLKW